jgi:hypothetical protein
VYIAILLQDRKDGAIVAAAGLLKDSKFEPLQNVLLNLFAMTIWDLELFDLDWFSCLDGDLMHANVFAPEVNLVLAHSLHS